MEDAPIAPPEFRQLRVPPSSVYDERAVLGACLMDNSCIMEVMGHLVAEDFYSEKHRHIFTAIVGMSRRNVAIDVLTTGDEMRTAGTLAAAGGYDYINRLNESTPTAVNVMHYVEIVKRFSTIRAVIGLATEIAAEGFAEPADVVEFLGRVQSRFSRIEAVRSRGIDTMADVCAQVADEIRLSQAAGRCSGSVSTGIPVLDAHLVGLHAGQLILVAARPGTGKTVTMLHMAHAAARDSQAWSLVASLEMTPKELVFRALSSAALISTNDLRGGRLSERQEASTIRHLGELSRERIAFVGDARTASRVRAAGRRRQAQGGLAAIFVDYIGLMKGESRSERKDLELGEIARDLKLAATELQVPVVCLVQLNREVEKRDGGRPRMSDLRNSGELEEAADVVLGLYRDKQASPRVLEVEVLKGRSAGEAKLEVEFDPTHTRIVTTPTPERSTWHERT